MRDAPLGQRADLADRDRDHVGGEGDRLGVEVAARERFVVVGEDQRIVGDAVGFVGERRRRLAQQIERRAHHLRLAAQAIGVLHARIAGEMRGADGAAGHQRAQRRGAFDLAAMAAQRMDARIERRVRAARRVESTARPSTSAEREQRFRLEQADERIGGRELRAVEQRQTLLRRERERRQPGLGERLRRRHRRVADPRLADADHRRRHMGERREIAGGADRALRRHDRDHAALEHRLDERAASPAARRRRPARGCRASAPSSAASPRRASARRRRRRARARCCAAASRDRRRRCARSRACRSRC